MNEAKSADIKHEPDELDALVETIKKSLDELLAAHRRKVTKRTFYWIGLLTRQVVQFTRKCSGLEPLKEEPGIIVPKKKDIIV